MQENNQNSLQVRSQDVVFMVFFFCLLASLWDCLVVSVVFSLFVILFKQPGPLM